METIANIGVERMEIYMKPYIASQLGIHEIAPLAGITLLEAAAAAASVAGFLYGLSKKDARPVSLPGSISVLQEKQNSQTIIEK